MDREPAVRMARMHRPVLGRLTFPVDDVSCRQISPPPTRARQTRICYRCRLVHHRSRDSSLPRVTFASNCADALLVGRATHTQLRLEAIPRSGHRLDESGRAPLVSELHPQLADVAIDDIALDFELTAPDGREKVLTGQRFSGVGGKEIQEGLLDWGEVEHATADADALFDEVDLEAIEVDLGHDRDGDPVGSSHEGERAGDDLIEREGDLEDVVGPALVGAQLHAGVAPTSEAEDGGMALCQATPDQVDKWLVQVQVDEDQMRGPLVQERSTLRLVRAASGLVASVLKR